MKSRLLCSIFLALLLAACNGQPAPTPTAVLPTSEPPTATVPAVTEAVVPTVPPTPELPTATSAPTETPADPTLAAAQSTIQSLMVPTMPLPGTLAVGSSGVSVGDFRSLTFTQTGGEPRTVHVVRLTADGTLTVDGVAGKVSADEVARVNDLLTAIDFFNIQGKFTGPSAASSGYEYTLQVETKQATRTIYGQDGLLPPELISLFTDLSALGTTPPG